MTYYDNPNQEVVRADGSGPAEEGTGGSGSGEPKAEGFDPGDHTVDEVNEYLAAHPDETDAVLTAEAAGKNRVTLVGEE